MQHAPHGFIIVLRAALAALLSGAMFVGCHEGLPSGALRMGPQPRKPGSSLTGTKMCTCTACEPASCCVEDQPEEPDPAGCADSYDFEKCGTGMTVSSCESRCFRHRWRTSNQTDCEIERPDKCCASSDRR